MVVLLLVFLLWNPAEAVAGSRSGLLLWFQSVVPVLLPFLILSKLLITWNLFAPLLKLIYPLTRTVWGLSSMGTYALLLGFLCGYPMGAKITGDLTKEGRITPEEGAYLLRFCNNVSPAFLLGYTLNEQLNAPSMIRVTLLLIYGIPLLLAVFWRKGRTFPICTVTKSEHKEIQASRFQSSFQIVDACIMNGLETILKLGCYIILFSIMARLAALIPMPYEIVTGIGIGILEITNGIAAVSQLHTPFLIRYLTILCILVFGGISGTAQTASMLEGSGLSVGIYIRAKLMTTGVVLLTAIALFMLLPSILPWG